MKLKILILILTGSLFIYHSAQFFLAKGDQEHWYFQPGYHTYVPTAPFSSPVETVLPLKRMLNF
jgi:hypothetical protein